MIGAPALNSSLQGGFGDAAEQLRFTGLLFEDTVEHGRAIEPEGKTMEVLVV